jgi:putative membrane protein
MSDFLVAHYDLWRGLHILSVIAWMAGLMYLPRLFAYHTRAGQGSQVAKDYFEQMERKLYRIIMNPAMIAAWTFGVTLIYVDSQRMGWEFLWSPPMLAKLAGIVFLTGWHHYLGRARNALAAGSSTRSEKYWRATNELPFLAAVIIVLCATMGVK